MNTVVLDTGALIALERRDGRMLALLRELVANKQTAHVSAGVVAQAWRGSPKQQPVATLLKAKSVRVHPLTHQAAMAVGQLLGSSGTADVVDAHVAMLAHGLRGKVVSSDPEDLLILDPKLEVVPV